MKTYKLTVFPQDDGQCEFAYTNHKDYLEHLEESILLDILVSYEEVIT